MCVLLSTVCFSLLTVAAQRDKPNEQGPPVPEAGRTQSLYCCLLQSPAQRIYPGRHQDLRGLWKQATAERPGIHLLCARSSGSVGKRKAALSYLDHCSLSMCLIIPVFSCKHALASLWVSDLSVFVLNAVHVSRRRGLIPPRLGRGYLPLVRCVTLSPEEALTYKKKLEAAAGPRSWPLLLWGEEPLKTKADRKNTSIRGLLFNCVLRAVHLISTAAASVYVCTALSAREDQKAAWLGSCGRDDEFDELQGL